MNWPGNFLVTKRMFFYDFLSISLKSTYMIPMVVPIIYPCDRFHGMNDEMLDVSREFFPNLDRVTDDGGGYRDAANSIPMGRFSSEILIMLGCSSRL